MLTSCLLPPLLPCYRSTMSAGLPQLGFPSAYFVSSSPHGSSFMASAHLSISSVLSPTPLGSQRVHQSATPSACRLLGSTVQGKVHARSTHDAILLPPLASSLRSARGRSFHPAYIGQTVTVGRGRWSFSDAGDQPRLVGSNRAPSSLAFNSIIYLLWELSTSRTPMRTPPKLRLQHKL